MKLYRLLTLLQFEFCYSSFRIKGLMFLIPFLVLWYLVLQSWLANGPFSSNEVLIVLMKFLYNDIDSQLVQDLFLQHPKILSEFLFFSLMFTPFFAMLVANNQLAGDIGNGTFRYLVTRATRTEIFLARFISAYSMVGVMTLLIGIISIWISLQFDQYSYQETLWYTLKILLIILIYMLPYIALMLMISASVSSALGAISLSIVAYGIVSSFIFYLYKNTNFDKNIFILPAELKSSLLFADTVERAFACGWLLLLMVIYGSLGWLIFRYREL